MNLSKPEIDILSTWIGYGPTVIFGKSVFKDTKLQPNVIHMTLAKLVSRGIVQLQGMSRPREGLEWFELTDLGVECVGILKERGVLNVWKRTKPRA